MSSPADQAPPAPPSQPPSPVKPAAVAAPANAPAKPGQWAVPKPGGVCGVSGRAIAPGERFMAAVRESPTGIERVDVAAEHWDAADKTDMLASWHAVMPKGEEKKKLFVDDEVLCTLFERLADATEPAKVNFRFVLGLILMRKRLVLYDGTRHEPDGRDVWVVRMRGRQDTLELVDPKLNAEQTLEVSQQLGQVLNEEL
ncbi:MAG TPA: hypothetical protein VF796_16915 [Humisphaera sp.]